MPIYLDYNATTPVAPEVRDAISPYLTGQYGNPSSSHVLGRPAHEAVEQARAQVAGLLGAQPDEIVFTSGGSESNNLAIKGIALRRGIQTGGHLVISSIEHPATVAPAKFLERLGFEVTVIGCDAKGVISLAEFEAALRPDTMLASIMHANNEIGTLQPIQKMSELCRARKIPLHTDAAQSVGKIPTRVDELGVDMLSIAGHKVYAPKGVGALYVRSGIDLEPLIHGAGHERGLRAGTENVPYMVALGTACELARSHLEASQRHLCELRERLWSRLRESLGEHITMNGHSSERLPNTLSVNLAGVVGSELLAACPDVCASTGAACHSGGVQLSATMKAIGIDPDVARGTLRLSLGSYSTANEVDRAAELLIAAWKKLTA